MIDEGSMSRHWAAQPQPFRPAPLAQRGKKKLVDRPCLGVSCRRSRPRDSKSVSYTTPLLEYQAHIMHARAYMYE